MTAFTSRVQLTERRPCTFCSKPIETGVDAVCVAGTGFIYMHPECAEPFAMVLLHDVAEARGIGPQWWELHPTVRVVSEDQFSHWGPEGEGA